MRVWDIDPGYLNRQSLLGEHREIHAILSIIMNNKKGYARHPETLRWKGKLKALNHRHDLVVSEMQLRGYQHHSPVMVLGSLSWPDTFVDSPAMQFTILRDKYLDREPGRIPLPRTAKELWEQHRFSVLARFPDDCLKNKQALPQSENGTALEQVALDLVALLRSRPQEKHLKNVLDLMWDHVVGLTDSRHLDEQNGPEALILTIRQLSIDHQVIPLLESTALSDLQTWISASSAE